MIHFIGILFVLKLENVDTGSPAVQELVANKCFIAPLKIILSLEYKIFKPQN